MQIQTKNTTFSISELSKREMPFFHRYSMQFLRNALSKRDLQFLIFFVTSRCNCTCSTCFNWKALNKHDELSLNEIKKISTSIGDFYTLLLSGGEPFLRKDLFEICKLFIMQNNISILSIPTNCTYPERIIEFSKRTLKEYPYLKLSINPSLDGFKETHDKIRGVDGLFDKVIETIKELSCLKKSYSNLMIAINTVITQQNINELEDFMGYVYKNIQADYHDFELLRGDYKDSALLLPPLPQITSIHQKIIENRGNYLKRNGSSILEKIAVTSLLAFTQNIKERHIARNRSPFDCSAGSNIGVIDANGDVKLCELLPPIGNLRNVNYSFSYIWNSIHANNKRDLIKYKKCSCTHICFINLTISKYFRSLFFLIYYYMDYKIRKWKTLM